MFLCRLLESQAQGRGHPVRVEGIGAALQLRAAALDHLGAAGGQPGEEGIDMRAHCGGGAKAGVGGDFFAHPGPDVLIGVEIRAVRRQATQAHTQVGRGQVGAQRLSTMGGRVVPDHEDLCRVVGADLFKEGD